MGVTQKAARYGRREFLDARSSRRDTAAGKTEGDACHTLSAEPNGICISAAIARKSIVLNFGLAADETGRRLFICGFDDTNPL
jgi:hypothetical protein